MKQVSPHRLCKQGMLIYDHLSHSNTPLITFPFYGLGDSLEFAHSANPNKSVACIVTAIFDNDL